MALSTSTLRGYHSSSRQPRLPQANPLSTKTQRLVDDYNALRDFWRRDPVLYSKQRFGLNPTKQQAELLRAIAPEGSKVSVRAGHGVGKTTALAIAMWWHLECFNRSRVPCTAPTAHQLRIVLWAELKKTLRMSDDESTRNGLPSLSEMFKMTIDRVETVVDGEIWFAQGRTARRGESDALQGFHNSNVRITDDDLMVQLSESGGALMFVVEEASGVDDVVFEVVQGALSSKRTRFIMVGNPTNTTGFFAKSHRENRGAFTALHFSCEHSPLVEPSYLTDLENTWGKGSNAVRVRYYGDFPSQDDNVLISLEATERSLLRTQEPAEGRKILGVDVARFGDDRTCFVVRQGRQILHVEIHAKEDTMMTTGRVASLIRNMGVDAVHVDEIGVGGGVVDRLNEQQKDLNCAVVGVNVSDAAVLKSRTTDRYANVKPEDKFGRQDMYPAKMKDYLWLEMKEWFMDHEPVLVTDDCEWRKHAEVMAAECATARYRFDSSGKIVVESKDDMKKRGLRSPDLADALACTFSPDRMSVWERLAG